MKQKKLMVFLLAAALLLSACGSKSDSAKETSDAAPTLKIEEEEAADQAKESEASEEADTEEAIVTDYGTVVLGQYKGLEVSETVQEITEEDIDYAVDSLVNGYSSYETVNEASESGDVVYIYYTATNEAGEVLQEYSEDDEEGYGPYSLYLGYGEYGTEFDEALTGVKSGDTFNLTETYDENNYYFPDETVTFEGKVDRVERYTTPELNETFITETLGYESEEDMREQLRVELMAEAEETALSTAMEELMSRVIQNSVVQEYDQAYYDETYNSMMEYYESYMTMFGYEDMDTFLADMGVDKSELEASVMDEITRVIVVEAIIKQEGIAPTEEEYNTALTNYASMYGFGSTEEFEEYYGKETVNKVIRDSKVVDFLYQNAIVAHAED